jgi:hypothetical protein
MPKKGIRNKEKEEEDTWKRFVSFKHRPLNPRGKNHLCPLDRKLHKI